MLTINEVTSATDAKSTITQPPITTARGRRRLAIGAASWPRGLGSPAR